MTWNPNLELKQPFSKGKNISTNTGNISKIPILDSTGTFYAMDDSKCWNFKHFLAFLAASSQCIFEPIGFFFSKIEMPNVNGYSIREIVENRPRRLSLGSDSIIRNEWASYLLTEHCAVFEPQNPTIGVFKLHKVRRSENFQARNM